MIQAQQKYIDLDNLILRHPHFKHKTLPYYENREEYKQMFFEYIQILVVGAGGLGCEILKDLALSGFLNIHVIDLDEIDVTNLNRQFLFRKSDVGKFKSQVAAEFIEKRVKGVKVTAYVGKIQDMALDFYAQFPIIIAGLDNIKARQYLNLIVHQLVEYDENRQIKPESQRLLIDGGTEGFRGQARVIIPYSTSCYECSINSVVQGTKFEMCTLANTPRQPEHCIQYVYETMNQQGKEYYELWQKEMKGKTFNKDSKEDMTWIYQNALERANQFDIKGVTYELTLGVVKNIIPAIASSNALIAAACVNEALKGALGISEQLNEHYFMYMGQTGVFGSNQNFQKNNDCLVCSRRF